VTDFSHHRSRLHVIAALVALVLAASACGSSSDDAADTVSPDNTVDASSAETTAGGDESGSDDSGEAHQGDSDASDSDTGDSAESDGAPATEATRARLGDRVLVSNLQATTGRFEGRISVSGDEVPDGIELVITGAFDSANDASEISLDLGAIAMAAAEQEGADLGPMAAMFEEPMVVRTIGTTSYLSWGLFSLFTGGQGTWIEAEADEAGDITSSFGGTGNGSPVDLLSALEDANAEITEIGSEEVRGVTTTHLRALIDIAALEESLTEEERATLERDLGDVPIEAFPIEFWIDGDGLVRRYSMDLSQVAQTEGDLEQATFVFEFFDYGEDITIEAPPADQIVSSDALDPGAFGFGN
jgi:hypothetical protein